MVVVDTGQFPTIAAQQIADIRRITDKPVRAIINTHWHWDHNLGNAAWRYAFPAAAIVSTPFTRNFIATCTPGFLEQLRAQSASGERRDGTALTAEQRTDVEHLLHDFEAGLPELRKVKLLPPDLTFDRELTINRRTKRPLANGIPPGAFRKLWRR